MAVYKVPQDVEAEDKLIGPFSFRQFIYLIVAAMSIGLEWVLAQVFIGLVLLPLPITILFIAIALPLRKDQPMELWLAAIVRFFMKPKLKMWWPEGEINLVTIIAPHVVEEKLTKDLTPEEAEERFRDLAEVIDTQGWSRRGINDYSSLQQYGKLHDTVIAEASTIPDVMDADQGVGKQFSDLVEEQSLLKTETVKSFQAGMSQTTDGVDDGQPDTATERLPRVVTPSIAQPFVATMSSHQAVEVASNNQQSVTTESASTNLPQADIIDLASNHHNMSISSIEREAAHRLETLDDQEVVIQLH